MFFRKAGKYLTILYVFYFAFFLILYFALFKDFGYANEVYTFKSIFSGMNTIRHLILPGLILLYFVEMVSIVRFLTDYSGKRFSFSFYLYYVFSSIFGMFFYLLFFAIVYFPFSKLITRLKAVSLTEIPVLVAYSLMFFLVVLLWKLVTYWKIKSRLNYFVGKYPSLKHLILPLNGFDFKSFLKFLLFVTVAVGLPLLFFIAGIINKNHFFVTIAVIFSYIVFPFGKIYVYYFLLDKKEI